MKCIQCGHDIPADSVFCPVCGAQVKLAEVKQHRFTSRLKALLVRLKNKLDVRHMSTKAILGSIAVGLWVLVLQNLGIIDTEGKNVRVVVDRPVEIYSTRPLPIFTTNQLDVNVDKAVEVVVYRAY